jgi:hypothetical protein
MSRKLIALAAFATATLSAAPAAHAQLLTAANKPFSFGAAAGAVVPISDLSNATNTGYNGTLILGLNTPALPMNFRIEGAYHNFGLKQGSGNVHNTSVTGNAVFTFPTSIPTAIRPYLIGGIGLYNTGVSSDNVGPFASKSSNDFGFNVGGGITIPLSGFNTFVEARYNRVATNG